MIQVTIDLIPWGVEERRQNLRTIQIANQGGSRHDRRGNYRCVLFGKRGQALREAEVKNWPRLSRPVEELVAEAVRQLRTNPNAIGGRQ